MGLWNDGGFFYNVKGHVIKWWQFVLMPVLRINNNGRQSQYVAQQPMQPQQPVQNMQPLQQEVQQPVQNMQPLQQEVQQPVKNTQPAQVKDAAVVEMISSKEGEMVKQPTVIDVQGTVGYETEDPMEVLRRINEEKETARRKDIEKAKQKASEEARIAAIMNANKVDVNAFIEAGKAAKEEIAARKADEAARREAAEQKAKEVQPATAVQAAVEAELERKKKQEEDLRRAQEIMERLNREAADDEAKKQAEIEAAKQEAKKQFG